MEAKILGSLILKMLSKVAYRLYWLARYIERAENTARFINVNSNLLFDLPVGTKIGWKTLIDITGSEELFQQLYTKFDERSIMKFLISDKRNPSSIISSLGQARENARTTREILPTESWEKINELYYSTIEEISKGTGRKIRFTLLQNIIYGCQLLVGLLSGTMSNNAAYDFMKMGRNLERADMSTRIIDMGCMNLLTDNSNSAQDLDANSIYHPILWMNILVSLSAFQMYRQHVRGRVYGADVIIYLLKDGDFPRAVIHCLNQIQECLEKLPDGLAIANHIEKIKKSLIRYKLEPSSKNNINKFVDTLQLEFLKIDNQITSKWFLK